MIRGAVLCLAALAASSGALAQTGPLHVGIAPGQSPQAAVRAAKLAALAAQLRASWQARNGAGATPGFANPSITAGAVTTTTLNVVAALPAPMLSLSFSTDTPGLAAIDWEFASGTGNQSISGSYSSPQPLTTGTLVLQSHYPEVGGTLSRYAEPGTWSLTFVSICDTAGDCQYYFAPALTSVIPQNTFTVVNSGKPDISPPTITAAKILTPTISLGAPNPAFAVTLTVKDTLSGVANAFVYIAQPGSTGGSATEALTPHPLLKGTLVAEDPISPTDPTGTWTIMGYRICDVATNCASDFTAADITKLFGKNTFTVTE